MVCKSNGFNIASACGLGWISRCPTREKWISDRCGFQERPQTATIKNPPLCWEIDCDLGLANLEMSR